MGCAGAPALFVRGQCQISPRIKAKMPISPEGYHPAQPDSRRGGLDRRYILILVVGP